MERKRVIITEYIDPAGLEILARYFDLVYLPDSPKLKLAKVVTEAYTIGVRLAPITAELMASAPHLKIVANHGVGYDNIDVAAATARRIVVVTTPKANAVSVAEHILSLMLCLANRICVANTDLKAGKFVQREDYIGVELKGKTLGVVGLGRIGSETARKCKSGFGMNIMAYDPYLSAETFERTGYRRTETLGPLLEDADFVVLCVPLTPETTNMIGARELSWMKPSSFLVKTSRGGIVNEAALYKALSEGKIAGSAMDVFVKEPPTPDNPLLTLDNFIATPHVAGATYAAMRRMATDMAEEIVRVLSGEQPLYPLNPEVYE
ncbi:MAG: hydroxyacid dehydrogenase [Dehalococcoidia bacterium]|nr:MAG: hydroxyacid dehydrogenase [Dehalococcoidia bacterium]